MKWLSRVRAAVGLNILPAPLRKLIVAVIGLTILLLGVVMVVLPGPAFIVIPSGSAFWRRNSRGLGARSGAPGL